MKNLPSDLKPQSKLTKKICEIKGLPIACYDDETNRAYLKYPDGRRVYVK